VSERAREWGYLAAIALVAIAIGAGALWLGERTGMGVNDPHGHELQLVEATDTGEPADEPVDEPETPHEHTDQDAGN
jgi:hypothetical protein